MGELGGEDGEGESVGAFVAPGEGHLEGDGVGVDRGGGFEGEESLGEVGEIAKGESVEEVEEELMFGGVGDFPECAESVGGHVEFEVAFGGAEGADEFPGVGGERLGLVAGGRFVGVGCFGIRGVHIRVATILFRRGIEVECQDTSGGSVLIEQVRCERRKREEQVSYECREGN